MSELCNNTSSASNGLLFYQQHYIWSLLATHKKYLNTETGNFTVRICHISVCWYNLESVSMCMHIMKVLNHTTWASFSWQNKQQGWESTVTFVQAKLFHWCFQISHPACYAGRRIHYLFIRLFWISEDILVMVGKLQVVIRFLNYVIQRSSICTWKPKGLGFILPALSHIKLRLLV